MVDNLKVHVLRHHSLSVKSEDGENSDSCPDFKTNANLIDQQNIQVVHSYVIFLCVK